MAILKRHAARTAQFLFTFLAAAAMAPSAWGALIVDAARPITQRLEIQIIRTSLDGGLLPATIFGNAAQRADIEADIDLIWAQAGIDVEFLPAITTYANTFAFQGALQPRPTNDLSAMISNARSAGKLHPDPQVINMLFVEIVPGFSQLGQSTAAGIANIGGNGIAVFTGESLLGSAGLRDVIAGVVGHEIGHNLGLSHSASGSANLMAPQGTTEQMTTQQIATVLQSSLLKDVTVGGDFTGDGIVNRADLTVWQNAYGTNANGDADGDGDTDGRDFLAWQKQYGTETLTAVQTVPEPASAMLIVTCAAALFTANSRRLWWVLRNRARPWCGRGGLPTVVVAALADRRGREAFYSTVVDATAEQVLTWYSMRWSVEVTFHDSKQQLGFEEPQGWSKEAAQRTAPMAMLLYSLIVHWYASEGRRHESLTILPWYTRKSNASFADMLATLKRVRLRQRISALGLSGRGSRKTRGILENMVNLAA